MAVRAEHLLATSAVTADALFVVEATAMQLSEKRKAIVGDALAGASAVVYLTELDEAARAEALRKELPGRARLIQFIIAGVDFIPLGELPEGVPVATNGGGYAESMGALADVRRVLLENPSWLAAAKSCPGAPRCDI